MKNMVEEQKKLIDKERRDDDSDRDDEDSSEDGGPGDFVFESAIDVGSHFIDVTPGNELTFQKFEGHLIS